MKITPREQETTDDVTPGPPAVIDLTPYFPPAGPRPIVR